MSTQWDVVVVCRGLAGVAESGRTDHQPSPALTPEMTLVLTLTAVQQGMGHLLLGRHHGLELQCQLKARWTSFYLPNNT